jgi:hypothetical protein
MLDSTVYMAFVISSKPKISYLKASIKIGGKQTVIGTDRQALNQTFFYLIYFLFPLLLVTTLKCFNSESSKIVRT